VTDGTVGYHVQVGPLDVGGVRLEIRTLLDRQQFWDPDGEAERAGISSASWPLFGLAWPSGRVLADAMSRTDFTGLRVLEMGCGLALASLVVQRCHGDITASDCHPLAGAFLTENLRLNRLAVLPYAAADWSGDNPTLGRFDLLVGSDVLYEPAQPALLARFIGLHATPTAQVIIVDPDRGNRPAFTRHMAVLGFAATSERITTLPAGGGPYKGRLLRYLRVQ